jgi:photosystem II stability/assembly factor-like uncharacterized protein
MNNWLHAIITLIALLVLTNLVSAQWVQLNGPGSFQSNGFNCLSSSGGNIFVGGRNIFLSTDNGNDWIEADSGLTSYGINTLTIYNSKIFAGTTDGAFISTDNGKSWNRANNGLPQITSVYAFASSNTNIFAGTNNGVFLSSNNGTNWNPVDSGLTANSIFALAVADTNLIAGTGYGLFVSTNTGVSWASADSGLTMPIVNTFAVTGTDIYAGSTGDGVLLSTNGGKNWSEVDSGLAGLIITALAASGTSLFAGIYENGVLLSTNNGRNWNSVNDGLPTPGFQTPFVYALTISGNYIFAVVNGTLWRRLLSDLITFIERNSTESLSHFRLEQNYPNPFNPTTIINYGIPKESYVTIKVYDILGREVATLVNDEKLAGKYEVKFDGSKLSSGVYFYQLRAGSYTATKKLLLIK